MEVTDLFPQAALRASDYNIYIKSDVGGEWCLVHGYRGSIEIVDSGTVKWLKTRLKGQAPKPKVISRLEKRGFLTISTPAEEQNVISNIVTKAYDRKKEQAAFTLIVSYDCNFRCSYCLQRPTQNKGSDFLKQAMSEEILKSAFRFMDSFEGTPRLCLYGGEPFLPANEAMLNKIFAWAQERKITITCISNGYCWAEFENFITPEYIRDIQVTVDGPPEIHDRRRRPLDGNGSFWTIIDNVERALKRNVPINLRINTDSQNIAQIDRLTAILYARGFYDYKHFTTHVYPVFDNKCTSAAQLFDLQEMRRKLTDLLNKTSGEEQQALKYTCRTLLYDKVSRAMENGRFPPGVESCGAIVNGWVLDPLGRLYACLERVGNDNKTDQIGTFYPKVVYFSESLTSWRDRVNNVLLGKCLDCQYVLLCGSGCQARAIRGTGSNLGKDCFLYPSDFEMSIRASLNERNERLLKDPGPKQNTPAT